MKRSSFENFPTSIVDKDAPLSYGVGGGGGWRVASWIMYPTLRLSFRRKVHTENKYSII